MHLSRWLYLMLAIALVSPAMIGCGDDDDDRPPTITNAITAADQSLLADEADMVSVQSVIADVAGFVVIHDDDAGAPGEVLGFAAVEAGTTTDLEVNLDRDAADGETLWAMLHVDDPADGEFTFTAGGDEDLPATDADGDVVVDSFTVSVESAGITPSVTVNDQIVDPADEVVVDEVVAAVDGYIVIHAFDESGELIVEPALGTTAVSAGTNTDVVVELSRDVEDGETLAAMLHSEENGNTTYDGADVDLPVTDAGGEVIAPTFVASITGAGITPSVTVSDQTADPADEVVVDEVVAAVDGYIVIHAFDESGELIVEPALGTTAVSAGTNTDVVVELSRDVEDGETLAAMLHSENNGNTTYDGAAVDLPVTDDQGEIITPSFIVSLPAAITPSVTVSDQTADPADEVVIDEVVAAVDGYIVIHAQDANGEIIVSPHLGVTSVDAGVNTDVVVQLDRPVLDGETLYAMLHSEDGENANFYDGAAVDLPVRDEANVIIAPAFVVTPGTSEPFVTAQAQATAPLDQVTVAQTVYDSDGWMVIHQDNGSGAPGAVIGQTFLPAGVNTDVVVDLDRNIVDGETLFAMLHSDDGDGVYEFPGADTPVSNSAGQTVTVGFVVTAADAGVTVADQSLTTVSTLVRIDEVFALDAGYLVIHEDDGGSFGQAIGVAEVVEGMNGPFDVALMRPAVDGETLYAMLHTENGGDPNAYDGAALDLPVTDAGGAVINPSFVVTVPAGTPTVIFNLGAVGTSAYVFNSVVPAAYDTLLTGGVGAQNPDLQLRQGWRYSFELGAIAGVHPIRFGDLAANDWVLLQGLNAVGSFESDAAVNWVENNGTVTFTLTGALAAEISDYQCQVHPGMNGAITVVGP